MAKPYLEKLSKLIQELSIENEVNEPVEVKHFFSGHSGSVVRSTHNQAMQFAPEVPDRRTAGRRSRRYILKEKML